MSSMRNKEAQKLLFEQSKPGLCGATIPPFDGPAPDVETLIPEEFLAADAPPLPEVSEPDLVRHFTNLSTLNMSVDTHFYPLGSCTMKYNPKRNERMASLPGFLHSHPYQPEETVQGLLAVLYSCQEMLGEIAGLPAVSLQPAAGAHGELTALFVAAAYFRDTDQDRDVVLVPDQAHGTNPASAAVAGFRTVEVKSNESGFVDLDDLAKKLDEKTAVFMITNPNTLGLFDPQIGRIAEMVHAAGGLIYLDGANMNAIMGITRPGDFGADMMHFNPHKTFSGPHGGGGPGAGPIAVTETLGPYLPCPRVACEDDAYYLADTDQWPQVDRPGPRLLRQRGRLATDGVLHPHAGPRRSAEGLRGRGVERQLPAGQAEALLPRRRGRPLHARIRRLGVRIEIQERYLRPRYRQTPA